MTVRYLPPGHPGESSAAALHRTTDSPAQARLRRNASAACLAALPFALVLAGTVIHDVLMIHGIEGTPHPEVHRARGVVDAIKPSRRAPVFRLSRAGEPPLQFTCSPSVAVLPRCPAPSPDWRARDMSVEWITLPTLWPAATAARITRMATDDGVVFVATPRAVQQAEVADLRAGIRGAWKVLGGLVLACLAVAALLRMALWRVTQRIAAAHRRARG